MDARRIACLACTWLGCGTQSSRSPPSTELAHGVVATYHAESTAAGIEILNAGGNAFDAFVAATFVDYVVSGGETSAAGPLGALVHGAADGSTYYLDGELDEVLDPAGRWSEASPNAGKAFAVPGAVAALAELSARQGVLPLSRVLEPAIRTARDGFVVDELYAGSVALSEAILKRTPYGQSTFFPDGSPVRVGSTLRLPELAAFLQGVADHGPAHMYTGAWASAAVQAVAAAGGRLSLQDLARFTPAWRAPRRTTYRGVDVIGPGGRAYAGLWALVGLEVLEHTQVAPLGHYSTNADALELMVRTVRTLHEESWFFDKSALDNEASVAAHLASPYTTSLWDRVREKVAFTPLAVRGSHSYHIIVADRAGNIVTGTNTIESMPFGEGLFVQGVPLNAADKLTAYSTAPGERRISPFSVHLAFQDGRVRAALGAFGTSLVEVELEMLVDILDYGMHGGAVAASPRFGTFPFDWDTGEVDVTKNWIDPRVPGSIVDELARRGLWFQMEPEADLGFGVAVTFDGGEPDAGAIRTYGIPVAIQQY